MIDVEDHKKEQGLLMAINEAIGDRIENDDIDASTRARACLTQAIIEIAHISDEGRRESLLDTLDDFLRRGVSQIRTLIENPPKAH